MANLAINAIEDIFRLIQLGVAVQDSSRVAVDGVLSQPSLNETIYKPS